MAPGPCGHTRISRIALSPEPTGSLIATLKHAELMVYGPVVVPIRLVNRGKFIDTDRLHELWEQQAEGLASKRGLYVFAMRAGRGFTPWYVGRTSKGFEKEIFTPHKVVKYQRIFADQVTGTPVLFFVAKPGRPNVVPAPVLREAEKELIAIAYRCNPALENKQHAKARAWSSRGVIGGRAGRPTGSAAAFGTMLGIR